MEQARIRAERVEVRRSREAILLAAEEHYARSAHDPTMTELAIAAGVGNATLYRRFPSIDDVVRALYERTVEYQQRVADEVMAQPTGWDAVVALLTGLARITLEHPAIPRVTRRMVQIDPTMRHGDRWDADLREITRRAHEEGMLRLDVDANDLTLAGFRLGEYANLPAHARARVVERQVAITIDGVRRASAVTPVPGTALSTDEIHDFRLLRVG